MEIRKDEAVPDEEFPRRLAEPACRDREPEPGKPNESPVEESLPARQKAGCRRIPWADLLAVLSIFAVVFVIYSNTYTVPFVFDDRINITDNPAVQLESISWESLSEAAFESPVPSRPLANLTLALNYYFHKKELPGYHLVNILLHAVNGVLLYFLFAATFRTPALRDSLAGPKTAAFAGALIWLAHPLQVQSVTYIVQRMNSLATLFYLAAMLFYVGGRRAKTGRKRYLFWGGCVLSGVAGFLCKEIVLTLPVFLFLYEFFFFRNLDFSWFKRRSVIGVAAAIIFVALILVAPKIDSILAGYDQRPFTMGQRLLTEPRVVVFHLSQFFYPHPYRFNIFHDFSISSSLLAPPATILAIAALFAMAIAALVVARRHRLLSFSILWYLGNLAIESSVIPLEIIFEHRNYLPTTFLCLLVTFLIFRWLREGKFKRSAPVVILIAAAVLAGLTYYRNRDWRTEEILLLDSLGKAPRVARTQASLGYALMWQWRLDEAMQRFRIALRLDPTPGVRERIWKNIDFIEKMKEYPQGYKHRQ
ncbi:MAG: hypothetical protein P1P81_11610 [Desulfobulbales bacterium]|nr:hypothetical protein [Desulfobulbales bacterium]